jgi:tocopherol cyclase
VKSIPFVLFITLISFSQSFAQEEKFIAIGNRPRSFYGLKKVWNPQWFQGNNKRNNYFEGWYIKVLSADGTQRYAFIPGVSLGVDEHSFIQVINGVTGETDYYRFPLSAFSYSDKRFAAKIGTNFFSADSFYVDLGEGEKRISASLKHRNLNIYPIRFFSPGIMGWYRFVPFMECFHGVVSLDHDLEGALQVGSQAFSFDGGRGYIEKDWGKSMPSAWVWTQSNSFSSSPSTSFMLSVANIPWMASSFTGFLGYLYANGQLYRFATYTGAEIKEFETEGDNIRIVVKSKKFTIEFMGHKGRRGALLAPVAGEMARTIHESIDASISVKLWDKKGNILFEGFAPIAGLEMVGDVKGLKPKK